MKRRMLALFLAVALCLGASAFPAQAAGPADPFPSIGAPPEYVPPASNDAAKIVSLSKDLPGRPSDGYTTQAPSSETNENEKLLVIVELESAPLGASAALLQAVPKRQFKADKTQAAAAAAATLNRQDVLLREQGQVLSSLKRSSPGVEAIFSYTAVLNGFSAEIRYRDIAALKANPLVKNVYLANTYEVPSTPDDSSSNPMIGVPGAWARGYSGDGALIAIVDTGVDYNHPQLSSLSTEKMITKEQMAERVRAAGSLNATLGSYYKNTKVVFGYDYCLNREDPVDIIGHGTHVAGIAAANPTEEGIVIGAAYNAQLMAIKVFSPGGGAADPWILAGVDDAVKLGADAINLSLGSVAGFSTYDGIDRYDYVDAFANANAAGSFVSCSAGNESYIGYASTPMGYLYGINLPYAAYPDYGLTGTPSTDPSAISVASVDNLMSYLPYFQAGDLSIPFTDTNDVPFTETFNGKTLEYAVVPGVGDISDYEGIDVEGKIALISRGELSFADKAFFAYMNGAVAAVIYNNVDGLLNMDLTGAPIPAIFIEKPFGLSLTQAQDKTMSFSTSFEKYLGMSTGGQISSFSSRGVTPDLKMKPEITAPGGGIYSTYPVSMGSYKNMDGTSMSTPHVTAAAAILKQRVLTQFPSLEQAEVTQMVKNLLMSSARPISDKSGNPVPVQSQGAGMVDLAGAVEAPALLYNTVDSSSKLELGDKLDPDGAPLSFIVENISGIEQSFALSALVLSDRIDAFSNPEDENDVVYFNSLEGQLIGSAKDISVSGGTLADGVISVPAGAKATVSLKLSVDEEVQESLGDLCPNGYYLDGFIKLTSTAEGGAELSIPFLGFVGDWLDVPVLDSHTVYEPYDPEAPVVISELSFYGDNSMFAYSEDGSGTAAGLTPYFMDFATPDHISFSPGGSGYYAIGGHIAPLRNIRHVGVDVLDAEGKTIVSKFAENAYITKAYSENDFLQSTFLNEFNLEWDGRDKDGQLVPEGQYYYKMRFYVDYPGADTAPQSLTFPVTVDNTAPTYSIKIDQADGRTLLTVTAKDNHFIGLISLYDRKNLMAAYGLMGYSEFSTTEEYEAEPFDITEFVEKYGSLETAMTRLSIQVEDYANNIVRDTLTPGAVFPEVTDFSCEPTYLADTCAAYVILNVEGTNLEGVVLEAYFETLDLTFPVKPGRNRIYLPKVTGVGFNFIELRLNGDYEDYAYYIVRALPAGLWTATAENYGGKILVVFADIIETPPKAYVNGAAKPADHMDYYTHILVDAPYVSGAKVKMEKVKFNLLFPSYSFTYNLICP